MSLEKTFDKHTFANPYPKLIQKEKANTPVNQLT